MRNILCNVPTDYNLFLAGDTQWGNAGTSEDGVDALFNALESEYRGCSNNYVVLMGDLLECISIDDPRFSWEQSKLHTIVAQREHSIHRLKSIKHRILVLLKGNHEHKLTNNYGDISAEIAHKLNCAYGGYVCTISFINRRRRLFRGFFHHGFGRLTSSAKDSVQARANIMAALKQKLAPLYAGAVLMAMGHTHQLLAVSPDKSLQITEDDYGIKAVYRGRDAEAEVNQSAYVIPPDDRWYVNTGSFLRTYLKDGDSYAEMRGLRPVEIGYAVATVREGKLRKVYLETV